MTKLFKLTLLCSLMFLGGTYTSLRTAEINDLANTSSESDEQILRAKKCKTFCGLRVLCNASIGGSLSVGGDIIGGGSLTIGGDIIAGGVNITNAITNLITTGAALGAYGYIYNTSASLVIGVGEDIPFDSNGILSTGITHTPGSTDVTIAMAGIYAFHFTANVIADALNSFVVTINDVPVPGAAFSTSVVGSAGEITGHVIVAVPAGAVVTVRNNNALPVDVTLTADVPGVLTPISNASLLIEKIA